MRLGSDPFSPIKSIVGGTPSMLQCTANHWTAYMCWSPKLYHCTLYHFPFQSLCCSDELYCCLYQKGRNQTAMYCSALAMNCVAVRTLDQCMVASLCVFVFVFVFVVVVYSYLYCSALSMNIKPMHGGLAG